MALTENPSNEAAEIFIVRNAKGGRVPTESPEEVARAAEVSELKRTLAEQGAKLEAQAAELQRRAILEEKAQCVEIARKVAPNLTAKDVDVGDVIYRVRAAARAAKDDTLEAAVNALFRAGSAAFEAAGLNRTLGSNNGDPVADSADAQIEAIARANAAKNGTDYYKEYAQTVKDRPDLARRVKEGK